MTVKPYPAPAPGGWRDEWSSQFAREQPLLSRNISKFRMEKKGRGGKTMTMVYDLPENAAVIKELAGELKRACGMGGAVVDGGVEFRAIGAIA